MYAADSLGSPVVIIEEQTVLRGLLTDTHHVDVPRQQFYLIACRVLQKTIQPDTSLIIQMKEADKHLVIQCLTAAIRIVHRQTLGLTGQL